MLVCIKVSASTHGLNRDCWIVVGEGHVLVSDSVFFSIAFGIIAVSISLLGILIGLLNSIRGTVSSVSDNLSRITETTNRFTEILSPF